MLLQRGRVYHREREPYFFFLGFFFFTPPADDAPIAADASSAAVSGAAAAESGPVVAAAVGCWAGWRFCIFCMSDRLRASNRLRNIDEYVLNFKHYSMSVSAFAVVYNITNVYSLSCRR